MKQVCVLPYLGHICDCGNFFPKKVSIDLFLKTPNLQKLYQLLLLLIRKMQNS